MAEVSNEVSNKVAADATAFKNSHQDTADQAALTLAKDWQGLVKGGAMSPQDQQQFTAEMKNAGFPNAQITDGALVFQSADGQTSLSLGKSGAVDAKNPYASDSFKGGAGAADSAVTGKPSDGPAAGKASDGTDQPRTYKVGDGMGSQKPDPQVKEFQQELGKLGYLVGSADGKYGHGTQDSVKDFQGANGLPATGDLDPATQQKLSSPEAVKNPNAGMTDLENKLNGEEAACIAFTRKNDSVYGPKTEKALEEGCRMPQGAQNGSQISVQ